MNQTLSDRLGALGVHVPRLLLPAPDVDLYRWSVIACDQHTSEPDYWEEVGRIVGDAPSTLQLVYPEVFLDKPDRDERIAAIHTRMREYLDKGVVRESEPAFVLTTRSTPHVSERRGLVLAIDLERYEFTPGAGSMIRATEQTILDRLPPRVQIRSGAPMEVPHVVVLVDDPDDLLTGGLSRAELAPLYSTQLMLGGGSVTGRLVTGEAIEMVADALEQLLARSASGSPFLFAVGDGNHSLAAAKRVWEDQRDSVAADHPSRYALVELVNLYDPGLRFEPIHRLVLTDNPSAWVADLAAGIGKEVEPCSEDELRSSLRHGTGALGFVTSGERGLITLKNRKELPVTVLEEYLAESKPRVDFIHGWDTSMQLAGRSDAVVLLLPEFDQRLLFPTVTKRGVLPRKAFSLGEAEEKRYYLEGRLIQ
jgi:hypothetical protein